MGLRGPAPKPVSERSRRSARNPVERQQAHSPLTVRSEADVVVPKPPVGILKRHRDAWERYWRSEVGRAADPDVDTTRVIRWIQDVDEFERTQVVVKRARLVKGSQGQPVLNPLTHYLTQLDTRIRHAEMQLGLTPLSRMRLGITAGVAKLTAAALVKALADDDDEPEPWEAEWDHVN